MQGTEKGKQETFLDSRRSYLGIIPILERVAKKKGKAFLPSLTYFNFYLVMSIKLYIRGRERYLSDSLKILFVAFHILTYIAQILIFLCFN